MVSFVKSFELKIHKEEREFFNNPFSSNFKQFIKSIFSALF